MDDEDPFFAGDDDFVWPELSSVDDLSDENVIEVRMCSVPSTPESSTNNAEEENLGFMEEGKVEDEERELAEELDGDSNKDEEFERIRADSLREASNLGGKPSLQIQDEVETVNEDEKNEDEEIDGKGEDFAAKSSGLEGKSNSKVAEGNVEIEIVNENDKNDESRVNLPEKEMNLKSRLASKDEEIEGIRVNFVAKSSGLEEKSNSKVAEGNVEIEIVKEGEKNEESRVNLGAKEMNLKSRSASKDEEIEGIRVNFAANSNPNVQEDNNMEIDVEKNGEEPRVDLAGKEQNLKLKLGSTSKDGESSKKEGINVSKASKSSKSAMQCLIEMLEQMYVVDEDEDDDDVDFVETVKSRRIAFPRNRGFDS